MGIAVQGPLPGTATIVQPLIQPMYGGKSAHEIVATLSETPDRAGYDIVREFWMTQPQGGSDPAAFQDDGTHQIRGKVGECGNVLPFGLDPEQVEQQELEVPHRRFILQHRSTPTASRKKPGYIRPARQLVSDPR